MVAALSRLPPPRCAPVRKVRRETRRTVFTTPRHGEVCQPYWVCCAPLPRWSEPGGGVSTERPLWARSASGKAARRTARRYFYTPVDIKTSAACCWRRRRRGGGGGGVDSWTHPLRSQATEVSLLSFKPFRWGRIYLLLLAAGAESGVF